MSSASSSDMKLEIGHVLFIDIVGYSKLLITEQSEQIQKLREIVRGTEQFRLAKAEGKLLGLPTGDGGALVFRTSPPALCLTIPRARGDATQTHQTGVDATLTVSVSEVVVFVRFRSLMCEGSNHP